MALSVEEIHRMSKSLLLTVLFLLVLPGLRLYPSGGAQAQEVDAPAPALDELPDASGAVTAVPIVEPEDNGSFAYDHIELLTEALLRIRKHYVDEKSYQEITYGALHGMLHTLDPHSAFLEPAEYRGMREDTQGHFSGIGVHIAMRDGVLTVIAPIEGTPGFRAGLQSGDKILGINGEKTMGFTMRDAVKKLRGPKGTKVTITVRSLNEEESRDLEIVRDDIVVASVKGARLIRDGVGYIRVTTFTQPTAESLRAAVDDLLGQSMNSLVLDLRGNPGGLLSSAVEVAQLFLEKGQLVVSTEGRSGVHDKVENKAAGDHHYLDFPMAILVNNGSASASEIVAGALQDHQRAVLVGDTTFGKGSVQSLIPLSGDGGAAAIRLTIAYYYTPSGRLIHGKGIDPDIPVYLAPQDWRGVLISRSLQENPNHYTPASDKEQYKDVVDHQLERAVDLLQAVRIFER